MNKDELDLLKTMSHKNSIPNDRYRTRLLNQLVKREKKLTNNKLKEENQMKKRNNRTFVFGGSLAAVSVIALVAIFGLMNPDHTNSPGIRDTADNHINCNVDSESNGTVKDLAPGQDDDCFDERQFERISEAAAILPFTLFVPTKVVNENDFELAYTGVSNKTNVANSNLTFKKNKLFYSVTQSNAATTVDQPSLSNVNIVFNGQSIKAHFFNKSGVGGALIKWNIEGIDYSVSAFSDEANSPNIEQDLLLQIVASLKPFKD